MQGSCLRQRPSSDVPPFISLSLSLPQSRCPSLSLSPSLPPPPSLRFRGRTSGGALRAVGDGCRDGRGGAGRWVPVIRVGHDSQSDNSFLLSTPELSKLVNSGMAKGRPGWVAVREGAEGLSLGSGVETAGQEPADGSLPLECVKIPTTIFFE